MECDGFQIQATVKVDSCDDVSLKENMFSILVDQKRKKKKKKQQEYTHCKVGTIPLPGALAPGVAAGVAGITPLPLTA